MLTFETEERPQISAKELEKMHIADVLDDDRYFKIFIDGQVFYDQPHFSMWELVQYSIKWIKRSNKDFTYDSIESHENPMLSFVRDSNGWKIHSVWQEFVCDNVFSHDEVKNFINQIISHVVA